MTVTHRTLDVSGVEVGTSLPELIVEITYTTLAKDVAGTRDIYPIHHDPDFAERAGVRGIFLNTMWYQGLLGRFATDWGGQESFVRSLSFDMRATNGPGDVLTVRGTVVGIDQSADETLVDLDLRIDNQQVSDTVTARLTVGFPR